MPVASAAWRQLTEAERAGSFAHLPGACPGRSCWAVLTWRVGCRPPPVPRGLVRVCPGLGGGSPRVAGNCQGPRYWLTCRMFLEGRGPGCSPRPTKGWKVRPVVPSLLNTSSHTTTAGSHGSMYPLRGFLAVHARKGQTDRGRLRLRLRSLRVELCS